MQPLFLLKLIAAAAIAETAKLILQVAFEAFGYWLVGYWLVGWLFVCWSVGQLVGWLVGWLAGWLIGRLFVG